ncbi:MAG TPA: type III-B CRISPR module-associated protein Cmr3 [Pyrinomonadaceae bacterium]|jgi:CRISPR-associated protein Cmr3
MSKETWLIEVRDALIVRDGRPFGNIPGARAKSLDFPFPSTLIGNVRSRVGLKNGGDWNDFGSDLIEKILKIRMKGALLTEIKPDDTLDFFAPAPADALFVNHDDDSENLFPLTPMKKEYLSNLPNNPDTDLHLLGITEEVKGKPNGEIKFWRWGEFEQWLKEARKQKIKSVELGIGGLTPEQRTHVRILDEEESVKGNDGYWRKANAEGGLFQTRGLEFNTKKRERLALAVEIEYPENDLSEKLDAGLFPLGGERRIVRWKNGNFDFQQRFSELFETVKKRIMTSESEKKTCRLILLTPAYFEDGFLPENLGAEIKAVAVNRAQVISGWDFHKKMPKPTRRLTPAGTVFFLELKGDLEEIEKWIDATWFSCVSDDEQSKRDGFGLAVLGSWDGIYHEI